MNTIKGAEFLIREVKKDEVFILEELTEEQTMLRDALKEFVDREVVPYRERFEKKDYKFTEETMRKLGEMGFLGLAVPEKFGGSGMGFIATMLATDYVSGVSGSLSTAWGAHTGIGTMPIYLYGTEEQKLKYLPDLTSGTKFGAYCLTEPEAGSDANSGKTTAKLTTDGKNYIVNGQKMWISNAGFAEILTIFARIGDDKNITAFILDYDKNNPNGITLGEEEHKLGIRASSTRQVFFNDTLVPVENMLGKQGEGFKIALNSLNVGRVKLAAGCMDSQRRVLDFSVKYTNERVQFGTTISKFGAIQQKLAEMALSAFVSESGIYRVAHNIEMKIKEFEAGGLELEKAELAAFEDFAIEAAILKVYVSEQIQKTSDEGVQIFGGMGFSEETPMESAWRDSRITRIYEGTNEINRLLTISMLLKKALKGQLDLLGPAMEVGKGLMGIPSFETPDYSELLSEEKAIIANLKKAFLMVAGKAVQKYGMDLENHQQLILCASNVMIEIYMAESAILRVEKLAALKGEKAVEGQIAIAKLNLYNAVESIDKAGKEAILYFSEGDEQRVMLMGLKRFTKYTNLPNVIALRNIISAKVIEENQYCF